MKVGSWPPSCVTSKIEPNALLFRLGEPGDPSPAHVDSVGPQLFWKKSAHRQPLAVAADRDQAGGVGPQNRGVMLGQAIENVAVGGTEGGLETICDDRESPGDAVQQHPPPRL